MTESFQTKKQRWYFNFFPAYRRTGARIVFIQFDYRVIKIKLPLNWKTRNYVGTIFGGSMFAAADPIYMVMLIKILGEEYIVWDKSAEIKFVRLGKETLYATFEIKQNQIDNIKSILKESHEHVFDFFVDFKNQKEKIVSRVSKKIYIAKKDFYNSKKNVK